MKQMVGFLIFSGLGLLLFTACSSGGSSSPSGLENPQTTVASLQCQSFAADMLAQNGQTPIGLLQNLAELAGERGLSMDQAAKCLDQNLSLQCSADSCLLREKDSL